MIEHRDDRVTHEGKDEDIHNPRNEFVTQTIT